MIELTIDNQVYQFNFGMGFMRRVNSNIAIPVDGLPNVKKNIGLQYAVAGIIDNDLEVLVNVLDAANEGFSPRVTRAQLDSLIDNPETDVDALFAKVLDFLCSSNATRKITKTMMEEVEKQKQKAAAEN